MTRQQVAGMVTVYNSPTSIFENISTYLGQIDTLYVIDNSDVPNYELVDLFLSTPRIHYHSCEGNRGIGYALNLAAQLAREAGYAYMLTMDDDSRAPEGLIDAMLSFLTGYASEKVGIVSAAHGTAGSSSSYEVVLYTMTSGNLLNLEIHKQIGGFWEELFIDHVDHEYGLRLKSTGFQVIELPSMPLEHTLGQQKEVRLWTKSLRFVSHSPIRMYYIIRNGLLVAKRHRKDQPAFQTIVFKLITKEWLKAIFLEDNRQHRISLLLKGINDARLGILGKLR